MRKMNEKGFTLVELMVVLAILGLLAGIGVPQYTETLRRSRNAADEAIVAVVQSAVDVYLAETGISVTEGTVTLQENTTGKKLNIGAKAPSILGAGEVEFKDFLPVDYNGQLPGEDKFKGDRSKGVQWTIDESGRVSATATNG